MWYSTIFLTVLYLGTIVAIVALWFSAGTDGQYHLSSENVRMISRYFPSALGTLNVILFRQLVREYIRMKPFIAMADQPESISTGQIPSKSVSGAFFPWQDITVSRGAMTIVSLLCQIITSFIVSLKVALLASGPAQVKGSGDQKVADWTLTLRVWPAFFLIIGHTVMTAYVLWIAHIHRNKSTGLRWDPVTIVDFAALFSQCDVAEYFKDLELRHNRKARDVLSDAHRFRLGYWKKSSPGSRERLVYGIGATVKLGEVPTFSTTASANPHEGRSSQPYKARLYDKLTGRKEGPSLVDDCGNYRNHDTPEPCKQGTWPACEHYPYRYSPGCGKGWVVLSWLLALAALVLAIYAMINGIVFRGFHLKKDWSIPSNMSLSAGKHNITLPPIDPTDPESKLVVYALVFRSAPVYVAGLFTATIVEFVDLNMRFMQPFINMFGKPGDAADTVLLAYITTSPLQVPITALAKGHYRVAMFSTLNTLSPLFPIFIGGLLSLTDGGDKVIFTFSLSAYIGIMVFLSAWTIALPFAYPIEKRLLPRQFYSMADLIAMCHKSSFLQKPYLDFADKRRTPSKEVMEARILLSGDRFVFGHYTDDKDARHLGFDVHSTVDLDDGGHIVDTHLVQAVTPAGELDRLRTQTTQTLTNLNFFLGDATRGRKRSNGFHTWIRRFLKKEQRVQTENELGSMRPASTATGSRPEGQQEARQRPSVAFAPAVGPTV